MTTADLLKGYIASLSSSLASLEVDKLEAVVKVIQEARRQRRQIFIVGNGGSAATASHMVCDLNKMAIVEHEPRLRAIALHDNTPSLTAWANDTGYEEVFSQQLQNFASSGDVLIAISTSGRSKNVIRAVETAKAIGLTTIGLTGRTGGNLQGLVNICVHVQSDNTGQIEDVHHAIGHMLASALARKDNSQE